MSSTQLTSQFFRTEEAPAYGNTSGKHITENAIIVNALEILADRVARGPLLDQPSTVRDYLRLRFAGLPHETFAVLFMDTQHRLIETVDMFRGTISQTHAYPREIAKEALQRNAAAVILCHNHPSGSPEPSRSDELLTQNIKSALLLLDIRVIDHIVVANGGTVSFAERGLM